MESTLNAALKIGYRAVDTAILYENEPSIGKVINEWIASGRLRREDLFVSTKLPPAGMYEDRVEGFVNASLDNLRLDYVDLYLMHSPEGIRELPGDGAPAEMDREVDHAGVWRVRFRAGSFRWPQGVRCRKWRNRSGSGGRRA